MEKIQSLNFLDEIKILNGYFAKFDDDFDDYDYDDEDFDDDDDFDDEDFDNDDDFDDEDFESKQTGIPWTTPM